MASPQVLGKKAEDIAADYYLEKGYSIVARNYRTTIGEIDIIVRKNKKIVFVEVKSGKMNSVFMPRVHFNDRKKNKLHRLAVKYLSEKNTKGFEAQIDLFEVVFESFEQYSTERFSGCGIIVDSVHL